MDFENPTFLPSMMIKITDKDKKDHICHSNVKDGKITYLGDSTHALRGKTVILPYIE